VRVFAVFLGLLYAVAYGVPTVLLLNGYYGTVGFVKAGATGTLAADVNTVGVVTPGGAAARAGIVPGDVVVREPAEHALAFEQLFDRVAAGRPTRYVVLHDGRRRIESLTPHAVHVAAGDSALIVVQLVRGIAIVLMGALLVLLRPSIMTAAFYVLCLQFGELAHPTSNLELVAAVPLFWKPLFLVLTCIVSGSGPAVAAIFCMRFPSGEPLPWWRAIEKAMIVVGVLTIVIYLLALMSGATYTDLGGRLYVVFSIASWLCYAVAAAAFMVRYAHASGDDRQRLRWVAIGLISFLVSYALFWFSQNSANAPAELSVWAQFLNVLPLTVLYAVIRHRVIDVRLAGGRAIAYASLSAVPVVGFSLVDLGLSNRLAQSKVALVVEIGVAVGFGFWVNSSQRRIDNLIESVFFHARLVAEKRLRRVAKRIAHVSERAAVDETLVHEPFEALQLVSSALFHRVDGAYVRVAQRAWPDEILPVIPADDSLALELVATGEPVRVAAIAWATGRTMTSVRPSHAVPLCVRHETVGILLLGEKRDGERFDALELSAVETLVEAAATAYDHLEAVEQRRLADELRRSLDEARRENETLRELLGGAAPGV
jgi:hypothetical protein